MYRLSQPPKQYAVQSLQPTAWHAHVSLAIMLITSLPVGVRSITTLVSVCLLVCLSAYPLACLKNLSSKFRKVSSTRYPGHAVARSSSDDSRVRYVLSVWWMTSCFSHNGQHGTQRWRYRRGHRAEASSQNFQRIRQEEPRCLTLSSCAIAANSGSEL